MNRTVFDWVRLDPRTGSGVGGVCGDGVGSVDGGGVGDDSGRDDGGGDGNGDDGGGDCDSSGSDDNGRGAVCAERTASVTTRRWVQRRRRQ